MSPIPFDTLLAGVRIGRIQGTWVLNPTFQQLEYSDVDIVVAGTEDAILMVEGGAVEVPEEDLLEGMEVAHRGIKELIEIQKALLVDLKVPGDGVDTRSSRRRACGPGWRGWPRTGWPKRWG